MLTSVSPVWFLSEICYMPTKSLIFVSPKKQCIWNDSIWSHVAEFDFSMVQVLIQTKAVAVWEYNSVIIGTSGRPLLLSSVVLIHSKRPLFWFKWDENVHSTLIRLLKKSTPLLVIPIIVSLPCYSLHFKHSVAAKSTWVSCVSPVLCYIC